MYITDKAYTKQEILKCEESMLRALNFRVTIASIHCFLVRYLKAAHADRKMVWLACYIAERSLQEYSMLKYLPSTIASCAVYLARKNHKRNPWSAILSKHTNYTESALRPCLREVSSILISKNKSNLTSTLKAVKNKYASPKYGGVANMVLKGI